MDLGIRGRTALVLGATGGLGGAAARALAAEGVNVAVAGRDVERLSATESELQSSGVRTLAVNWAGSSAAQRSSSLERITNELGPVDILVNVTGGPPPAPIIGTDESAWEGYFRLLVGEVISTTDLVVPAMRARGWGRIITSTSSGVVAPIASLGISNTLRSGLVAWSKTLAGEVGRDGVTANVIVPGRIATNRTASLDAGKASREGRSVDEVADESARSIPVGRYGEPSEFGSVVAFLASAKASYITGSTIRVDGGMIQAL